VFHPKEREEGKGCNREKEHKRISLRVKGGGKEKKNFSVLWRRRKKGGAYFVRKKGESILEKGEQHFLAMEEGGGERNLLWRQ